MTETGSSSLSCFRQIVRLILAENIQPGGRLPTQAQLRRRFAASNKTLDAAMDRLVAAGVVTRKTRTGTLLADRSPLLALRWHVGLLTFDAPGTGPGAFYAHLHHALAVRLSACGWAAATYVRVRWPHWPRHRLADFSGLENDLASDRIDGLLALTALHSDDWRTLDAQGVAGCQAGPWDPDSRGVFLDMARFEADALAALIGAGCRRIGRTDIVEARGKAASGPPDPIVRFAADPASPVSLILPFLPGIEGGRRFAETLLGLPATKQPDGLIVPDDHAAAELLRLCAAAGRRPPRLAVLTNRQTPVVFGTPVLAFELDIDELADRAVQALRGRVLGTTAPAHTDWVAPTRKAAGSVP